MGGNFVKIFTSLIHKYQMNFNPEVTQLLNTLEHPFKQEIFRLRELVLLNPAITEHIKWNAPSFCVNGDDRITMKYMPPKNVQLVFHRGAKTQEQPEQRLIEDTTGLLKWITNDRAVATFSDMKSIEENQASIDLLVKLWIAVA